MRGNEICHVAHANPHIHPHCQEDRGEMFSCLLPALPLSCLLACNAHHRLFVTRPRSRCVSVAHPHNAPFHLIFFFWKSLFSVFPPADFTFLSFKLLHYMYRILFTGLLCIRARIIFCVNVFTLREERMDKPVALSKHVNPVQVVQLTA